jgi:hypothetical protein
VTWNLEDRVMIFHNYDSRNGMTAKAGEARDPIATRATHASALRGLLDQANGCRILLREDEAEAIEDAIALYEFGDEGEVTT